MTITTTPLPHSNWQYWHTMHVPMDGGVYSVQVYAPALPRITAEAFVEIGTPPLAPHPAPEVSSIWLVLGVLAAAGIVELKRYVAKLRAKPCRCKSALWRAGRGFS